MFKKLLSLLILQLAVSFALAQIPSGYYNAASGKSGAALKTALCGIIYSHTNVGYDGLFTVYADSDIRPDGKIWDTYSNITSYALGDHTSYKKEGDCYNREHSVPQSWFSKASPMKSDAFHVVPTDGYVNNRRGNYPYGEVESADYSSANGFSKFGSCKSSLGYTGKVFEPNDEYKGDFARIYFYMATCYENQISSWGGVFGNGKYPGIAQWQLDMLLRWAENDPVSQKEIDRNNAVYKHQKNRNPFVDFPGLEQLVWGSKTSVAFNPADYTTDEPSATAPEVPQFSISSSTVEAGTVVTITSPTEGSTLHYAINGAAEQTSTTAVDVTISATTTITARAEKDGEYSASITEVFTVQSAEPQEGTNVFTLVTNTSELKAGAAYIIVCQDKETALGAYNETSSVRYSAPVSISAATVTTATGGTDEPALLTLGGSEGAWTLFDGSSFLGLSASSNKLHALEEATTNNARWTITISSSTAKITPLAFTDRQIMYNANSPRFACYTGSQQSVSLYAQNVSTGIALLSNEASTARVDVVSLDGRIIRHNVPRAQAHVGLPRGFYVIGGRKVLVR